MRWKRPSERAIRSHETGSLAPNLPVPGLAVVVPVTASLLRPLPGGSTRIEGR